MMCGLWHRVRDGTRGRRWLLGHVEGRLRAGVRPLLGQGVARACAGRAGACEGVLKPEPALWAFARREGVGPTNDAADRALRPAVMKRERSFGCHGEAGLRFAQRLLSVTQALRIRKRPVLEYLVDALAAHRHGLPAPRLLSIQ